jgi:hypothetical protein
VAPSHVRSMPGSTSLRWQRPYAAAPSPQVAMGSLQVPCLGGEQGSARLGREEEEGGLWDAVGYTPSRLAESAALALVHLIRLDTRAALPCGGDGGSGGAGLAWGMVDHHMAWGMVERLARHILPWTTPSFQGRWQPAVASCVCTLALALEPQAAGGSDASTSVWRHGKQSELQQSELALSLWRACRGLLQSSDDQVFGYGCQALSRLCRRASGLGTDRWPGGLGRAMLRWGVERQVQWLEGAADGMQALRSLRILAVLVPVDPAFLLGCSQVKLRRLRGCSGGSGVAAVG